MYANYRLASHEIIYKQQQAPVEPHPQISSLTLFTSKLFIFNPNASHDDNDYHDFQLSKAYRVLLCRRRLIRHGELIIFLFALNVLNFANLPIIQDGTLTDSIAAVEAAWGKVAKDLGLDPEYVIAATHGKRAIDNLAHFRPEIKPHEMDEEVSRFEQTILDFADAFNKSRGNSRVISRADSFSSSSTGSSDALSELSTPALSNSSSRATSFSASGRPSFSFGHVASFSDTARRPSFATRLNNMLAMSTLHEGTDVAVFEDDVTAMTMTNSKDNKELVHDIEAAWEIESDGVDRSIRILPGVKNMIESIPAGRYAVATSGAKTYGTFNS